MDYQQRLKSIKFSITTGDGIKYTPLMLDASIELNFNTREFLYLGQAGSYIGREEAGDKALPLSFYFEGNSHVEDMQAFMKSTDDKRPWKISHPFYDNIIVQPTGKLVLTSKFGQSWGEVTVKITLPEQLPAVNPDAKATVEAQKELIDSAVVEAAAPTNPDIAAAQVTGIATNYNLLANTNSKIVALKDKVRAAVTLAQSAISKATEFAESMKDLIAFPFKIIGEMKSTLAALERAFDELFALADRDIKSFETASSMMITTAAAFAPSAKYENVADVEQMKALIVKMYEARIQAFDSNGYKPDSETEFKIDLLTQSTLGQLAEKALGAKQEYVVFAEQDAAPQIYASRFYGSADDGLIRFIDENKIGGSELLTIKTGRRLVYYA